ncbi:MAG: hypothetical protein ACREOK_01090, partial [Gemmatimonadaceae bacterium]
MPRFRGCRRRAISHICPAAAHADAQSFLKRPVETIAREERDGIPRILVPAVTDQHKKLAEDRGFEAYVEKTVLDGHGHIDVALSFGELRVACEISVTTRVAHEVGNLTKCLAAGFDYAVLLSSDERLLSLAQDEVKTSADDRIQLMTLDRLGDFLDEIAGTPAPHAQK